MADIPLFILVACVYMAPTGVAYFLDMPKKKTIMWLNILLGWFPIVMALLIIWVCLGVFVTAFDSAKDSVKDNASSEQTK